MINDTDRIKRAFNRAAQTYDLYCDVQLSIGVELLTHLQTFLSQPKRVIDLGCGTGLVTEKLINILQPQLVYGVDIAEAVLQQTKWRLKNYNVILAQQDFQTITYDQQFDLIFSNMALHWSECLPRTLFNFLSLLRPQGIIAFSVPLFGTFQEIKPLNKHSFYGEKTINKYLQACGYQVLKSCQMHRVLTFDSMHQALHAIKALGAHVVPGKKDQGSIALTKKILTRNATTFHLTYCLGIFIGKTCP